MGFRFSLATVLQVRDSIEKREELALQKVQFEISHVKQRIELLTIKINEKQDEQNKTMQQPIHARDLQVLISEISAGIGARQALRNSLETLEQEQKKRMKAYHAAHAARQMLTEMLNQQRDSYEREQVRNQQKVLDEIFSARAWRN